MSKVQKFFQMFSPPTCYLYKKQMPFIFYYAYGNSIAEDICLYLKEPTIKALLLGVGDVRNILHTMSESLRKQTQKDFEWFLNDWQPDVIARNLMIMYAIEEDVNADLLAQFWYSLEWTELAYEYWTKKINECLKRDWTTGRVQVYDEQTLKKVKFVWKQWLEFDWSKDAIKSKRKAYKSNFQTSQIQRLFESTLIGLSKKKQKEVLKEFMDMHETGSLVSGTKLNPSLVMVQEDGTFVYALHYDSNPYLNYQAVEHKTLKEQLLDTLTVWIRDARKMKYRVVCLVEHALKAMDQLIVTKHRFDLIETSNLADHLGILNLLVSGSVLLDTNALLKLCSFKLYSVASTREEFLNEMMGLSFDVLPTVLGLEWQKPVSDIWYSHMRPFCKNILASTGIGMGHEYFYFRKCRVPSRPVELSGYIETELLNCAKKLMRGFNEKTSPMESNVTTGLFGKMVAFAIAQRRLVTGTKSTIPFQDGGLWKKILYTDEMRGTMSEIFTFANLYGFAMDSHSEFVGKPVLVKHVFETPESKGPTPIFVISFEIQGTNFTVQTLEYRDLTGNKTEFTFYLPPFVQEYDPKQIVFSIATGVGHPVPMLFPGRKSVTLDRMKVQVVEHHALKAITEGAMVPNEPELLLPVLQVTETKDGFTVKLELKDGTTKLAVSEKEGKFIGLKVNDKVMNVSLGCDTTLSSCKIHRKSGFVLLLLKKKMGFYLDPVISTNKLKKTKDAAEKLGFMFDGPFSDVKHGSKPESSLSKMDQLLYGLKENVQILFVKAMANKVCLLHAKDQMGVLGVVVFHGIYNLPAVDSSSSSTTVIDASLGWSTEFSDFIYSNYLKFAQDSSLIMEQKEVPYMKELFSFYEKAALKPAHPDVPTGFKRMLMYPLYTAGVEKQIDENFAKQKTLAQKNVDAVTKFKQGDMSGITELMNSLGPKEKENLQKTMAEEMAKLMSGLKFQ